ncbi:hypothetical protein CRE_25630 [Caenorhabditis remanei]|uniref:T-box domain-containing protein n=1 Tax=Caenorhabditis remanei TaxID=31234 RepID=E3ML39_CAERE|nr:hypothetical protein CRE_25630 [Caenorhabditis remanei]
MDLQQFGGHPRATRSVRRRNIAIEEGRGIILLPDPVMDLVPEYELSKFLPYEEKNVEKPAGQLSRIREWEEVKYRPVYIHEQEFNGIMVKPLQMVHNGVQSIKENSELTFPSNSYVFNVSGLHPETRYIVGLRFEADPVQTYEFDENLDALLPKDLFFRHPLNSMEIRLEEKDGYHLEKSKIDFTGLKFGGCFSGLENATEPNVILLKIHRKWTPIVSISVVDDDETTHIIREFEIKEMEIISKHTYTQYQVFGKNRAAFPEFVNELNNKDYQKQVRDCPDLKKCLEIARQWETGTVPQPDEMELPFRSFPKQSEDGEIFIYIRTSSYIFENRKDFEEKVTQMEKNLQNEKKRRRWEAEDLERDEVEDQEYEPGLEEKEEEPRKVVVSRRKAEKRKTSVKARNDKKKVKSEDISPAYAIFKKEWEMKKNKDEEAINSMWDSIPCGTRGGSTGTSEWSSTNSSRSSLSR